MLVPFLILWIFFWSSNRIFEITPKEILHTRATLSECVSPVTNEAEVRFPTKLRCALLFVEKFEALCLVLSLHKEVSVQTQDFLLVLENIILKGMLLKSDVQLKELSWLKGEDMVM